MTSTFKFTSNDGADLCRQILKGRMPYDTHDFQLSAITHLLDGQDVLMCTATGTGKTDTFIRLMHIVLAISENPSLAPGTRRSFARPYILGVILS
jgi:hypothetical protein